MVFRLLILAFLVVLPAVNTGAAEPDSLASTSSFYTIRRDVRRCASPMCGGYFIKLVNQSRTRCANGRNMAECYVAEIQWDALPEPQNPGALVRGSLSTRDFGRRALFGVLRAREVWLPAGANQPTGTYFRVRDRGIRCIAAPCETHHEAKLNTSVSRNVAGVDLSGAGAADSAVGDATTAMTGADGVLVAGVHSPVTGPAGRSQMLKASQFYLRVRPGGTSSNNSNNRITPNKPCFKTGCSSQVCSDQEVITTCEWREEYACYRSARCERQANGQCGFTDTPELRRCLRRN